MRGQSTGKLYAKACIEVDSERLSLRSSFQLEDEFLSSTLCK